MTETEAPQFLEALAKLGLLYGKEIPAERLSGYFDALRDLPWFTLRRALEHIQRTEQFFPTVAGIRETVQGFTSKQVPRGSYPPDVAAQRLRYGLDVTLPVRPDQNAKFGQRWGIEPKPGMSYDDIVAEAKRRGAKPEDHNE